MTEQGCCDDAHTQRNNGQYTGPRVRNEPTTNEDDTLVWVLPSSPSKKLWELLKPVCYFLSRGVSESLYGAKKNTMVMNSNLVGLGDTKPPPPIRVMLLLQHMSFKIIESWLLWRLSIQ
jgi:hypothetical protein